MQVGLEALKVVWSFLWGALLMGLTLGNLTETFEKALVWSLTASLAKTMLVLMIWMDSWGALCLPLISMSKSIVRWQEGVLTHLGNSASKGSVSELLVHVDSFSSGQVSEDNTVVLENGGVLFVDLEWMSVKDKCGLPLGWKRFLLELFWLCVVSSCGTRTLTWRALGF